MPLAIGNAHNHEIIPPTSQPPASSTPSTLAILNSTPSIHRPAGLSMTSTQAVVASPNKRQKTMAAAKKKNAFEIMAESAKLCWPSGGPMPFSTMLILEIVAGSGWFSWQDDEAGCQNEDYSNLRLISRDVKTLMDSPTCGGPDFEAIADFLDMKNGFDDIGDEGFCDHCFSNEGEGCDTCTADNYTCCPCKKSHRHGPVLLQLDPRLNPDVKFDSLSPRERAKRLLKFLRQVAFNFLREYYENGQVTVWHDDHVEVIEPELTSFETKMLYGGRSSFMNQLKEHNLPFFNFMHHLLFTGWADNDCPPGSCSPFPGRLVGDHEAGYNDWNGDHRECFHDITLCFIGLHKSDELKTIPPQEFPDYSVSQIQHIPETIRRCVMNSVDQKAEALLGKCIADSIDLYRLVRETYDQREEALSQIQWMPCLGGVREEFVPLDDFQGYNPQHERENIDYTSLHWVVEDH